MPKSVSQTIECSSIVMPDRQLEGEQASWVEVCSCLGVLKEVDQVTILGNLLLCHGGEALCDPTDHFLQHGLGHFREVMVKGVVATLIDLELFVCAGGVLVQHLGASDVAEHVSVAVQQQEGPADGGNLPLDTSHRSHHLRAKRHPQAAMVVQLIKVICLHLLLVP